MGHVVGWLTSSTPPLAFIKAANKETIMRILSWFFLGAVLEGFTRLYEFASRSQGTVVPCRGRMSPNRSALSSSDVGSITVSEDHGFFSLCGIDS